LEKQLVDAEKQDGERGAMVQEVEDAHLGAVLQAGVVPRVPESPGSIRWTGPDIGAHSDEVLRDLALMDVSTIAKLRQDGVIL